MRVSSLNGTVKCCFFYFESTGSSNEKERLQPPPSPAMDHPSIHPSIQPTDRAVPSHAMPYHTIPYHTIPYHTLYVYQAMYAADAAAAASKTKPNRLSKRGRANYLIILRHFFIAEKPTKNAFLGLKLFTVKRKR